MSAPRLNRQLVLEATQQVPDGAGGFSESWAALGMVWAEVTARSGRDRLAEGVAVSSVGYKIIVRGAPVGASDRPEPGQRFRDGPRIWRIEAVAERDPEGRYLTCFAKEEVVA